MTTLAVDRQGKSTRPEFFLEEHPARCRGATEIHTLNAGNFHALLIGNQKYEKVQRLNTPEADVLDIAPLLRTHYGFKVKVLLNDALRDVD